MTLKKCIAHVRKVDGKQQLLMDHLKEVAHFSKKFATKIGLGQYGEIIGFLHDLGKCSNEFQRYIKSAEGILNPDEDDYINATGLKGKIDHSTAGAQIIYKNMTSKNGPELFVSQILSLCLVSHHSGLIDCISPTGIDVYFKRMNKASDRTHLEEILRKNDAIEINEIIRQIQSKDFIHTLITSLKLLKTSEDSRETFLFKSGLLMRFLYSCLIDADRLSTADFEKPIMAKLRNHGHYHDWSVLINRLNEKLKEFDTKGINAARQKVSLACYNFSDKPKGLYQLTVPTGGGKTLASLRFALHHAEKYGMDRIIYVLPYTTIIDQNAEEIRKVMEEKDNNGKYLTHIVLEHHSNLLPEQETAHQKVLSEDWDASLVLTTNVQVLEALFGAGTRGARRMHQLANSVIIFDEVQTLPVNCVQLFNTAVNFLVNNCGSTVVLCTATQPLLNRIEPKSRALQLTKEQEMITDVEQLFSDLRRVEIHNRIKDGGWSNEDIKELARQKVVDSGSVLIVVNTKTSAHELYQLCNQIENVETYHLSTHMCPAHRMKVLDQINDCLSPSNKPVICISTQLIEAGIDISFGSVIRFLAGIDSIIQAAGRCNRHNERYPALGDVYVLNPQKENVSSIDDIRIGKEKAERLLGEFKDNPDKFGNSILSPEIIDQYYQYYFYQRANEMNYPVSENSPVGREDNLFNLLSTNSLSLAEYERSNDNKRPEIPFLQSFMSAAKSFNAIETSTRGIIVPYGKEGKEIINELCSVMEIDKQYKLLHRSQRYSVNVFPNVLKRLQDNNTVYEVQKGSGILYLDAQYYSDEIGLTEIPVKSMEFLNC